MEKRVCAFVHVVCCCVRVPFVCECVRIYAHAQSGVSSTVFDGMMITVGTGSTLTLAFDAAAAPTTVIDVSEPKAPTL